MSVTKIITLRLEASDYDRLEAEAEHLGVRLATLARMYVRAGLIGREASNTAQRRQKAREALERLAALTAQLPPVDAVAIARASRDELNERGLV